MMRTHVFAGMCIALAALFGAAGCATTAANPAERAQVMGVMEQWKACMLAGDMTRLASLYSERFTSEFGNKAEVMAEMADLARRVAEQDGRLDIENADITFEDGRASVKPVSIGTRKGAVCRSFCLDKENGCWIIVEMGRK